jgi:hypothetical protein
MMARRRFMLLLVPFWILSPGACKGDKTAADLLRDDATADSGSLLTTTDPSNPTRPLSDEEVARLVIEGEVSVEEGMHAIAWSDGFPVKTTKGTYLFLFPTDYTGWGWAGTMNKWTPVPMEERKGLAWIEMEIPDPEGQRYKFVHNTTWLHDPMARSYMYDEFGENSYVRPPTDSFRLDRWPALESEGLAARDLRVYVPAGEGPWPVLYAQDGQNLFDPSAYYGGWRLQEAVGRLGEDILVVGIDHGGEDRMDEYAHTTDTYGGAPIGGKGDDYVALVHGVIRPHIQETYATKKPTGVMGSSMGGLISLYIAHEHPNTYDYAASLSGSLWFGTLEENNPTMQELWTDDGVLPVRVYVDSGGGDGGDGCNDRDGDGYTEDDPNNTDSYCINRQFADALSVAGFAFNEDLFHWHEPGAEHNEAAWSARIDQPLRLFLELVED